MGDWPTPLPDTLLSFAFFGSFSTNLESAFGALRPVLTLSVHGLAGV